MGPLDRTRLCILSLPLAVACAGVDPGAPPGRVDEAIVGGDPTTLFPAVPYLEVTSAGGGGGCSGSLVSPRVVLTAAHCLDPAEFGGTVTGVSAYFGSTVGGGDGAFLEEIPGEEWIFVPDWSLSGGDFGLILLEHDGPVEPLPYNTSPLSGADEGSSLHLIGWGNTTEGAGAGAKREVTVSIGSVSDWLVEYGGPNGNTCQGDSGGPGFLHLGGQDVVASVTSWGQEGCTGNSGAGRVDRAADYIATFVDTKDIPRPPTVSFANLSEGDAVHSEFPVQVDAQDDTRISAIELWIDGAKAGDFSVASMPYVLSTAPRGDGPVTLEARAYDNRGAMTSSTIHITVCTGDCEVHNDGSVGSTCDDNADCTDGLCGTLDGESLCTTECTSDETCPDGFECRGDETGGYCWPPSDGGGGCAATGEPTAPALPLLFLALLLVRRRRSPAGYGG